MTCDHGMMLMSEYDDAYVDAMLMDNMQANTRSVTPIMFRHRPLSRLIRWYSRVGFSLSTTLMLTPTTQTKYIT